jgi:hypothetical protein
MKEEKAFTMSEIPAAGRKVDTVDEASNPETKQPLSSNEEKPSAFLDKADRIREELGILDGQVTLTFIDDGT